MTLHYEAGTRDVLLRLLIAYDQLGRPELLIAQPTGLQRSIRSLTEDGLIKAHVTRHGGVWLTLTEVGRERARHHLEYVMAEYGTDKRELA